MRNLRFGLAGLAACLGTTVLAQQWTPLAPQPPVRVYAYFLLMDGRVLANECEQSGLGTTRWWTLTPDASGSYRTGTWAQVGGTVYTHLYFASSITPQGKVLVAGGEYSTGGSETNKCELFDPVTNTWSQVTPPSGWSNIGDAPAATLPDGRMIVGDIFGSRTALYDPATNSFSPGPNKLNSRTTEETWIALPDGTVASWDCFGHPGTERYLPSTNRWIFCGNTPVDLVLPSSFETGAGIVLPDGRLLAIGGTPRTCFYQYPQNINDSGTWSVGPTPPLVNGITVGAEDAPAALTPNGRVLMPLGRVSAGGGEFFAPTYFFEYDGASIVRIPDAPNSSGPPYVGRLLVLPTGEILWTAGTAAGYLYTNGGSANPAWKPAITSVPGNLQRQQVYTLQGTLLTGVSNGCSYGDEYDPATNYPLVRLTNTATQQVYFARAFNPSTRKIQTGNSVQAVDFELGANLPDGPYQLRVVTNGIASDPANVQVGASHINLTITGACPGTITVRWTNAQPSATVALVYARNTGSFVIPFGPCQGTALGLGNQGIRLVNTFPSGSGGSGSRTGPIAAQACRDFLQMHDIPNCTLSNVAQIP